MTDEEKFIVDFLKANENKVELSQLKIKGNLSGKKWDIAMKGLSKNGLTKVAIEGESKMVELIA